MLEHNKSVPDEEGYSFQERSAMLTLVASLVVDGVYGFLLYRRYQSTDFDTTDLFRFWGTAILILIGLKMVIFIAAIIANAVVTMAATNEAVDLSFEDERDRLIELLAKRNGWIASGLGFLAGMVALAVGRPPTMMFVLFLVSMAISDVVEAASKLRLYRQGV